MAYADPQSVTISGTANSLPRVSSGVNSGAFSKDDSTVQLSVSHAYGKRTRRTARINHSKIAADPLQPTNNTKLSASVYIVVDTPVTGYTVAEAKAIVDGLTKWLTDTTGANTTKLLGGEN